MRYGLPFPRAVPCRIRYIGRGRKRRVAGLMGSRRYTGPWRVRECRASSPAWRRRFLLLHGSGQGLAPAPLRTGGCRSAWAAWQPTCTRLPVDCLGKCRARLDASDHQSCITAWLWLSWRGRLQRFWTGQSCTELHRVARSHGRSTQQHLVTCRATSGGEVPKSTALGNELRLILLPCCAVPWGCPADGSDTGPPRPASLLPARDGWPPREKGRGGGVARRRGVDLAAP